MIRNLTANYVGTVWTAVLLLLVPPLYVGYLGIEAYGLLGVHATLTSLAALTDLGLTPTLNREISRNAETSNEANGLRSLVRSLEVTYWVVAVICAALMFVFLPTLVSAWLNSGGMPKAAVQNIVKLMVVQIGLQMLVGFYTGGLLGLQRHVLLNAIVVVGLTVRNLGGVLVLKWYAATLEALMWWMVVTTALQVAVMAAALLRHLPPGRSNFDLGHLRTTLHYAGGVSGIVALSLVLTQIDKVILSHFLPLAEFGAYSLASTITMTLCKPVGPIFNTVLPVMTKLVAQGDDHGLARIYHRSTQLAALAVLPMSTVLVAFAPEIVALWIRDVATAQAISPLVAILAVGYACNSLVYLPYGLSLAHGWVRYGLYQNAICCVLMVPLTVWLVHKFGAPGAAASWALLNVGCIIVSMYVLHQKLLPGAVAEWYVSDTLPALLASGVVVITLRQLVSFGGGWGTAVTLAIIYFVALAAAAFSLKTIRDGVAALASKR